MLREYREIMEAVIPTSHHQMQAPSRSKNALLLALLPLVNFELPRSFKKGNLLSFSENQIKLTTCLLPLKITRCHFVQLKTNPNDAEELMENGKVTVEIL